MKKKRQHAHARPTPPKEKKRFFRRRTHKHRWVQDPAHPPVAFREGGRTRYWVYYKCTRRGCPGPVKAEKHPKLPGKPWWRQ